MGTLQRIKEYIDLKGLTNKEFEISVGFSNGAFASQLKNNRTIGVDKLENILSIYPDLSAEWLLTGKGDMFGSVEATVSQDRNKVPLFDVNATASVIEIFSDDHRMVPVEFLDIPGVPKCDGAIYINGDSMYPLLKSGDIVAYKMLNSKANILWGEMYLLFINNEGDEFFFVKYVQKSKRDGFVKLVSQNDHHEPMEFPIDSIQQIAHVKASIRINSKV